MRVAIVGGGVAGLVAARELSRRHEITAVGTAATISVAMLIRWKWRKPTGRLPSTPASSSSTNRTIPSSLDSSAIWEWLHSRVRCRSEWAADACGIEYSSRGLRGLFARPAQALRPSLYRMAIDIVRFNRWAIRHAEHQWAEHTHGWRSSPRGAFRPTQLFTHYLRPMTGAIWSSPGQDVDAMPLSFLLASIATTGSCRHVVIHSGER